MFGYVVPDKPNLYIKDFYLYRSIYCGICVTYRKKYGQVARLATTYDAVFLSMMLHNYLGEDYVVEQKRCILHPLKKRGIAKTSPLEEKICAVNLLLMYHKIGDDLFDRGNFKSRLARAAFRGKFRKAKREYPEIDGVIADSYAALRRLEEEKCASVDRVADPFARSMAEIVRLLLGDKFLPEIETLSYNLGKWIYLIDAVDDIEEDYKRGNFNPFLTKFTDYTSRESFIIEHREDISFCLYTAAGAVAEAARKIPFVFNADLIYNITERGLRFRTNYVMERDATCKKIRI